MERRNASTRASGGRSIGIGGGTQYLEALEHSGREVLSLHLRLHELHDGGHRHAPRDHHVVR